MSDPWASYGGSTTIKPSKNRPQSDDGFLGLGFGTSLHKILKGASEAPGELASTAGDIVTGSAGALYNAAGTATNAGEYGLAKLTGNQKAADWYAGSMTRHMRDLGGFETGMLTGAASGLGTIADVTAAPYTLTALATGLPTPGRVIRGVVGTGLADVGGMAAGKIHVNPLTPDNPENVAKLQQMGQEQGAFNQGSVGQQIKQEGVVKGVLGTVGNVALAGGLLDAPVGALAEHADANNLPSASALANLHRGTTILRHPLKNTVGRPISPLLRAGYAQYINGKITPAFDDGTNVANENAPGISTQSPEMAAAEQAAPGTAVARVEPGGLSTTAPTEAPPAFDYSRDVLTDANREQFYSLPNSQRPPILNEALDQVYDKNAYADEYPNPDDARRGEWRDITPEDAHRLGGTDGVAEILRQQMMHDADEAEARGVHFNASTGRFDALHPDTQGVADRLNALGDQRAAEQATPPAPPVAAEVPVHPDNVPQHSAGEAAAYHPATAAAAAEAGATSPLHEAANFPRNEDGTVAHTAEQLSPTAAENTSRAGATIPKWATSAVSHLNPEGHIVNQLAKTEIRRIVRTSGIVSREMERGGIEMPMRAAVNEPFMRTIRDAVQQLQRENKTLQPEEASRMIGQAVADRLTGADKLEGGPGHHVLMPDSMRSPAISAAIDAAEKAYPEFAERTKETLLSSTHGERGISEEDTGARETRQITKLSRDIKRLEQKAERAGKKVPREVIQLRIERQRLLDKEQLQGDKIARHQTIRNAAADRLEELRRHVEPREPKVGEPMTEVRDEKGAPIPVYHGTNHEFEQFDMGKKNYPGEGHALYFSGDQGVAAGYGGHVRTQYLDIQNPAYEAFPRSGISDEEIANLKAQGHDGIIMADPARPGNKEYMVFDASQIHDTPDTLPTKTKMPPGQTAAQMARTTPAEPNPVLAQLKDQLSKAMDRRAQLPTEPQARRGTSVVSSQMHDEITQLDKTIADTKDEIRKTIATEKPNAALNRGINLAYSVRDIQDAGDRIAAEIREQAKTHAAADELQRRIDTQDTRSNKVRASYDAMAAKRRGQLAKAVETLPVNNWPRELQPAGRAYMMMVDAAKNDPELARLIGDAEPTYKSFVQYAVSHGMDPKYVADLTPDQVRAATGVRPGIKEGETMVAGARKEYNARLDTLDARDNSIEAFQAARAVAHQEVVQNMKAGYVRDNFGVQVHKGDVISNDLVSFDPDSKYQIEPRETAGHWTAPADGYVIPKQLASAMVRADKDYNHWFQQVNKTLMNPWRNAVITASPQFYINHTIGHAVLATIEGVKLHHWNEAWQSAREHVKGLGDENNVFGRLTGESAVGQGTAKEPTLEGPLGFRDAITRTEGSKTLAGTHAIAAKLHNATNFVDTLSRTATYIAKKEKGYTDAEALNKAVSNLVDYNDMSPFEQQIVRAIVPFYSFQKQIFKIAAKLPVDHPVALAIGANFGRINQQQLSDQFGTAFPQGYAGLINAGGGATINTRGVNAFKDATSLASADGIIASLNPILTIAGRVGFNAPSGGYVQSRKEDPYGNLVPEVNPLDEVKNEASFLPFVQGTQALLGNSAKGAGRGVAAKFGLNTLSKAEMDKLLARIKGTRAAVKSGAPYAPKPPTVSVTNSGGWGTGGSGGWG